MEWVAGREGAIVHDRCTETDQKGSDSREGRFDGLSEQRDIPRWRGREAGKEDHGNDSGPEAGDGRLVTTIVS